MPTTRARAAERKLTSFMVVLIWGLSRVTSRNCVKQVYLTICGVLATSVGDEEGEAGEREREREKRWWSVGGQAKVRWDFMGWGSDDRANSTCLPQLGTVCAEM